MALTKAHNRMIADAAVNVKDFGAVGDGVTDDTAAIQAALDHVAANGGTLYFPAGTYLSDSLQVTPTASFEINGFGTIKKEPMPQLICCKYKIRLCQLLLEEFR